MLCLLLRVQLSRYDYPTQYAVKLLVLKNNILPIQKVALEFALNYLNLHLNMKTEPMNQFNRNNDHPFMVAKLSLRRKLKCAAMNCHFRPFAFSKLLSRFAKMEKVSKRRCILTRLFNNLPRLNRFIHLKAMTPDDVITLNTFWLCKVQTEGNSLTLHVLCYFTLSVSFYWCWFQRDQTPSWCHPNIKDLHVSYISYLFKKIKYDHHIKRLNLGPGSESVKTKTGLDIQFYF